MAKEIEKNQTLTGLMDNLVSRGIVISSERVFEAAMERGRALSTIHERKLYKEKYRSFNSCVAHEFGVTSQQARNLMTASDVYDTLRKKFSVLPDSSKKLLSIYAMSKKSGATVDEVWSGMLDDKR